MTIVTRPINNEPDLLTGNEFQPLIILDLDENQLAMLEAPDNGWTHDELERLDLYEIAPHGWDAKLV